MPNHGGVEGFLTALREEGVDPAILAQVLDEGARSAVAVGSALLRRGAASQEQLLRAQRRWAQAPAPRNVRHLGRYEVLRLLGRGGMGEVYLVRDPQTGAELAAKRLVDLGDPEERLRFAREAKLMARLRHPHVVDVHAAELDGPTPYYVMTCCPGGSLQDRLSAGPLGEHEARELVLQLGSGLAAVHAAGILHRDLKPDNVVFDEEGRARLTDFGLGLALTAHSNRLTQSGEILGTPSYMAPEQIRDGKRVDARSDVYALGGILYACLTGQPPIPRRETLFATLHAVLSSEIRPPRELVSTLDPSLEATCLRALARDPDERYPTVLAFCEALESNTALAPNPRRHTLVLALVLALAAVLTGGAALATSARHSASPAPTPISTQPQAATATPDTPDALVSARAHLEAGELRRAWLTLVRHESAAPELAAIGERLIEEAQDLAVFASSPEVAPATAQTWRLMWKLAEQRKLSLRARTSGKLSPKPDRSNLDALWAPLQALAEHGDTSLLVETQLLLAMDTWIYLYRRTREAEREGAARSFRTPEAGLSARLQLALSLIRGSSRSASVRAADDALLLSLPSHLRLEALRVLVDSLDPRFWSFLRSWVERTRNDRPLRSSNWIDTNERMAQRVLLLEQPSPGIPPDFELAGEILNLVAEAPNAQAAISQRFMRRQGEVALCAGTARRAELAALRSNIGEQLLLAAFDLQRARATPAGDERIARLDAIEANLELIALEIARDRLEHPTQSPHALLAMRAHARLLRPARLEPALLEQLAAPSATPSECYTSIPWYVRYRPKAHRFPCEDEGPRERLWLPPAVESD